MAGCIGNLYESVEKLSDTYVQSNQNKNLILKPKLSTSAGNFLLLPPSAPTTTDPVKYYRCNSNNYNDCRNYITNLLGKACPRCRNQMSTGVSFVASEDDQTSNVASMAEVGYVKGVVTYMVMDDLLVTPLSTISSITLLNKFNVQNVCSLEEKVVGLGMKEGLELLKTSLQSKTVLSDIFLGKK